MMTIKSIKVQRRDFERDDDYPSQWSAPRVYFWQRGGNVLDSLRRRGTEPHEELKLLLPQVLSDPSLSGSETCDPQWNRHAGCRDCPCSPGFVIAGVLHADFANRFDIHVEYDETGENAS